MLLILMVDNEEHEDMESTQGCPPRQLAFGSHGVRRPSGAVSNRMANMGLHKCDFGRC